MFFFFLSVWGFFLPFLFEGFFAFVFFVGFFFLSFPPQIEEKII